MDYSYIEKSLQDMSSREVMELLTELQGIALTKQSEDPIHACLQMAEKEWFKRSRIV